jgi:hypothetical protein
MPNHIYMRYQPGEVRMHCNCQLMNPLVTHWGAVGNGEKKAPDCVEDPKTPSMNLITLLSGVTRKDKVLLS